MQVSKTLFFSGIVFSIGLAASVVEAQTSITIATVNNDDMIRMQALSANFTEANPDIELNWVTLEENVLRQRVTTDIATEQRTIRCRNDRDLRSTHLGRAGLARTAP